MAFTLLRQVPGRHDDGRVATLLAELGAAAGAVASALGARPEALREVVDALSTGRGLPAPEAPRRNRAPPPLHAALEVLRLALFEADGRERESRLLWREALATAWLSASIARLCGGSPGSAGLAGLLHRAGEALALRAVVAVETAGALRLDASSVQSTVTAYEPELTSALVRGWRLAPGVAAALQGWRRVGESAGTSAEARAVHYAHAFASQVMFAEFPAPGLAEAAGEGLRLDRRELARLREGFGPLRQAIDALAGDATTRR